MADPIQMRAKEKRLAEALRANLRRRKELARERSAVARDDAAGTAEESSSISSNPQKRS